jgi:metal-responsive CopG/Arc/MetJ family transcriptional regulator
MKKIIQVPVDENLLDDLDAISKEQHKPRAKLIREACTYYVHKLETDELDKAYQKGYKRVPEPTDIAEAQLAISSRVIAEESW